MITPTIIRTACLLAIATCCITHLTAQSLHVPPAPMFRDPVTDGAADPVIVQNRADSSWWMLYTQRRANTEAADVAYCYGTAIGVATSPDHGHTWVYRGTLDLETEHGQNTFWAPDVVYKDGVYHMFVTYIQGVRIHWGGEARMAHYTSTNLWDWHFEGFPQLSSRHVIDATLFQLHDKSWRMWYKDSDNPEGNMLMAASKDLTHWQFTNKPIFPGKGQEGPKVFELGGYYWLMTDEWHGMRMYRSTDLNHWEKQSLILDDIGVRPDDTPTGAHGDVVVVGDKAYVFYFTHPGRKRHGESPLNSIGNQPYELRRSSIEVAQLQVVDGRIVCTRNEPFDFYLP